MEIRITAISGRNGGEEVEITFELSDGTHSEKRAFLISSSQYLVLCPQRGISDEQTFDEIKYESDVWSATKRGIFILGYGACSEKALAAKLISKGFERDIAADAVRAIVAKGLLRPGEDASREAEKMVKKLWGKRRIISALYEKGYSAEAVREAIRSLEKNSVDYEKNCKRLIREKYADVELDVSAQAKIYAALSRYGYSSSEIKSAMLWLQEKFSD